MTTFDKPLEDDDYAELERRKSIVKAESLADKRVHWQMTGPERLGIEVAEVFEPTRHKLTVGKPDRK